MIQAKTPLRVSFIGGGTDYKSYYANAQTPGFVFGMTIDKFVYTSVFFKEFETGSRIKLDYKERELLDSVADVRHPIIREILKIYLEGEFVEVSTHADVPAGTGLGSSSSFCVSLIAAMAHKNGTRLSQNDLASLAVEIEREILQESGGVQDQFFASFGGCLGLEFNQESVLVNNLRDLTPRYQEIKTLLDKCFILVPIGLPRSSQIVAERTKVRSKNQKDKFSNYASEARTIFENFVEAKSSLDRFEILRHAIQLSGKFKFDDIIDSSENLSIIFQELELIGVSAAKLCGAGESGFVLALVEPSRRHEIANKILLKLSKKVLLIQAFSKGCNVIQM